MTAYAFYEFRFGYLKIGYGDAVHSLECVNKIDCENSLSPFSDTVFTQLNEYLDGKRRVFDFPIALHGSEFQMKVWRALCDIPFGETRTYLQIARAIGNSGASRAVGTACRKNPIWIAIPCHRVVGSNGKLTGYAGGLDMKQALLNTEQQSLSAKELSLT